VKRPPFCVRVLVEVPLPPGEGLFSYWSPEPLHPGEGVTVPLGKTDRPVAGVVLGDDEGDFAPELLKPVLARSGRQALDGIRAAWLGWIWSHYLVSAKYLLRAALAPAQEWIRLMLDPASRESMEAGLAKRPGYRQILDWLTSQGGEAPRGDCPHPALLGRAVRKGWLQLEGRDPVPGEIGPWGEERELVWAPWSVQLARLEAQLELVRSDGWHCLVLVPEPSLAQSLAETLARRKIGVIPYIGEHSPRQREKAARLAQGEGSHLWVGHQQALFLPFRRLGGVFVLQEESLGYRGRPPLEFPLVPAASQLARLSGARLTLFSRSPSMESYLETYRGLRLHYQAPESKARRRVVERRGAKGTAPAILEGIRRASQAGKRSLVYLNRRGYANALLCTDCGQTFLCPTCSVSLTPHRDRLLCHYCGYQMPIPVICPNCRGVSLEAWGVGTERLEDELGREAGSLPLIRLDAETAPRRDEREALLERFRNTPGAVLLTTGLVRGSTLPKVALLAILNLDYALIRPSYRSTERAYQLLSNLEPLASEDVFLQVSTRRRMERLLQAGPAFYREELEARKQVAFPPHGRLLRFLFSGMEEAGVWKAARHLRQQLEEADLPLRLDGPLADTYPRLRGLWRVELLARFPQGPLPEPLRAILAFHAPRGGIELIINLDPED
jgi:primosomal protein N' (replication factor Y)